MSKIAVLADRVHPACKATFVYDRPDGKVALIRTWRPLHTEILEPAEARQKWVNLVVVLNFVRLRP